MCLGLVQPFKFRRWSSKYGKAPAGEYWKYWSKELNRWKEAKNELAFLPALPRCFLSVFWNRSRLAFFESIATASFGAAACPCRITTRTSIGRASSTLCDGAVCDEPLQYYGHSRPSL